MTLLLLSALLAQAPVTAEAEVFVDRGETYIRLGFSQGLTKGVTVEVVSAADKKKLGSAVVMEVWDALARVNLDSASSAFKGQRLARVREAAPAPAVSARPAEPPPIAPPPPGGTRVLNGRVTANGPGADVRRLVIYNRDGFDWHGCTVRLQDGRSYAMGLLRAQEDEGIMMFRFAPDGASREAGATGVLVRCDEGSGVFPISI